MVPVSNLLSVAVTAFISLGLPVLILAGFAAKCRKQGILSAWLLGAAGFLVTQICIRLPILSWLGGQNWFVRFSQEHIFLYAFCLAATAGLFELAGRYGVAKILQKKLTLRRAAAAGLGHGGIEAMVIVGMAYINNLTYLVMIQSGSFDAMLTQVPAEQAVYLESIRRTLVEGSALLYLAAGYERLLTMVCHLAMSMLACWGVHSGKVGKCMLACLALHTAIDLTAGISLLAGTVLSQGTAFAMIYSILTIAAAISAWIVWELCRRWKRKESEHEFQV